MAINAHKLGPGNLSFGAAGSLTEFGAAIRKAELVPESKDGDQITVLSGDKIVDEGEETWQLAGELMQSYKMDGLVMWCFANRGKELPFTYRANSAEPLTVKGVAKIKAIKYGGEVGTRNTSEFAFALVGDPEFVDGTPVKG